ncbi:MAG: hypothetical protein AABX23_04285 [Nanoarchaeota archaeon]
MVGHVEVASESDLKFLERLDKRLHYVREYDIRLTGKVEFDCYHPDKKINEWEAERLLKIVRKNVDLILYPINTNWGFSVGFCVAQATTPFPGIEEVEARLLFLKKQLPDTYGWDNLASVFNSLKHIERVQVAGLVGKLRGFGNEGFEDEGYYDY